MAESVVERGERTTSSPSLTRTIRRLALRGLVVAGFAGGIWLLSGSAAHAAGPHGSGPHGNGAPDSTGPVANLITGMGGNGIGDLLGTGSSGSAVVDPVSGILAPSDATSIARPGGVLAGAGRADTTTQVVNGLAGSLGIGGDRAGGPVDPVAGGLLTVAGPGRSLRPIGLSGVKVPQFGTGSVAHRTARRGAAKNSTANTGVTADSTAAAEPGADITPAATHPAGGPTILRGIGDRHVHRLHAGRDHRPNRTVHRADRVGSRHGPVQPERAPFPAYPDLGLLPMGSSTSGSASHHLGDSAIAVAPSTVVGVSTTSRRGVPARDVEVLRLVAETPTVSPD
jgi:hypothetical protein